MNAHRYRDFLRTAALTLLAICLGSTLQADPGKPHVLFIMADDHAAHAIGAYGGRLAQLDPTPTIDRLAEEGILFTNAFRSNSICAPSRATILTGKYAHTHGGYDLRGALEGSRQYLAIEMRNAGYQTAMIGNRNPRRSYAADLPPRFPKDFPEGYDPADYSDAEVKRLSYNAYLKNYLRCVKGIDDNLARLFAYLEETGELDNTLIIYTSDQGFMLGEHDYQDKGWMYDESMRMPLLIRYPRKIPAGARSDAIVENVDFAPTILEFVAAQTPDRMQGRSFKIICETNSEPEDWKQEAYYRYWMHMAHHDNLAHLGIRTKSYSLIFFYGYDYEGGNRTPPAWELYDLETDPCQNVNVYDDPDYAQVVVELKERLARLRKRVGDTGQDYPAVEEVVQEFWDYDEEARAKAIAISREFRQRREKELER